MSNRECLYRIQDIVYASPIDEFGNITGLPRIDVEIIKYKITSRTKKGVWIFYNFNDKGKFVNLSCKKKFACETIEEARISFIKRKERQRIILSRQLYQVDTSLNLIHQKNFNDNP